MRNPINRVSPKLPAFAAGCALAASACLHAEPLLRVGGAGMDYGKDVTLDAAGNLLVASHVEGAVDFDSSAEVRELSSTGSPDVARWTARPSAAASKTSLQRGSSSRVR